jgi:hypothetical protein
MKVLLIVVGSIAGLYAVTGVTLFVRALATNNAGTLHGGANIAASLVPPCLGLIVSIVCFQRALRKSR